LYQAEPYFGSISIASSKYIMASLPNRLIAKPLLIQSLARFGSSFIALSQQLIASSYLPNLIRAKPLLLQYGQNPGLLFGSISIALSNF
jgi:hypothetical protein